MTPGGTFIAYFTGANRSAANAVLLLSTMTGATPELSYEYIRALRPIVFVEEISLTHVSRVRNAFFHRYPAVARRDLCMLEGEKAFLTENNEVWCQFGYAHVASGHEVGSRVGH